MKWNRILVVLVLFSAVGAGAATLGSPSLYMKGDGHRSAVVEIARVEEDGRFKLRVIEELHGHTPEGLVVRAASLGGELIEVGEVYIVGHTDKPQRRSPRWTTDPAGPRVLNVPAVGLAVFENSEPMRTLVQSRSEEPPLSDRARLAAIVDQLQRPDRQSRRLVLTELVLVDEVRELVGERELEVLKSVLAGGSLEPMAHEYLLRAARPMLEKWGSDWLAVNCREVVGAHGTDLDLRSMIPSLLETSLELLGEVGVPGDAELASRHVASNNPGVGRAAFSAVVALDRELAARVAAEAAEESLHPDTLQAIRSFESDGTR